MSSFYSAQYNRKLSSGRALGSEEETTPTFGETAGAAFGFMQDEGLSVSRALNEGDEYRNRLEKVKEAFEVTNLSDLDPTYGFRHGQATYDGQLPTTSEAQYNRDLINNGDVRLDENLRMVAATKKGERRTALRGTRARNLLYEALLVERASQTFPDRIESDKQMLTRLSEGMAVERARNQSIMRRGPFLATMAGTAGGALTDPLVAGTMFLGYGWLRAGAGIATNMGKAFASEAVLATGAESVIQAEVFDYKRSIDSPYTTADALFTVATVGLGAGVARGASSGLIDAVTYGRKGLFTPGGKSYAGIKEILNNDYLVKAAGKAGLEKVHLQDVVEEIERRNASKPETTTTENHSNAVDVSRAQAEEQAPIDVEAIVPSEQVLPGGRLATNKTLEEFDPAKLETDAKLMQYKAGGDAEGVTDALTSVSKFDRTYAGLITVYERTDGTLIVADGHQRLGLAKRALAAGQDPADVVLQGFRLREANGVTPQQARIAAAMINVADDKGTAIDAAKILRDVTDQETLDLLEATITKKSAAYTQGQSLAKLEGDAFGLVVNGDVKPSYAAIVGDLISGEAQQLKALDVLRRTDPSNIDEARSIVNQVKALGFTQGTTTDLFGAVDIANNLFIERAQLIGAMMARLKKEKATFNQLLERETTITGRGNKLDQEANLEAKTDAENVLNQIERLANTTGPVSEAITRGAQRIADGEKPNTVVGGVIKDVSRGLKDVSRGIDGDNGPGGINRGAEPAEGRAVDAAPRATKPNLKKVEEAFKARGVDGDDLLNAQDLVAELLSVGARIDDAGIVTVYHRTTPEAAAEIQSTGKMFGKEPDIFFSTSKDSEYGAGFGTEYIRAEIPAEQLRLDDVFPGKDASVSITGGKLGESVDVKIITTGSIERQAEAFAPKIDKPTIQGDIPEDVIWPRVRRAFVKTQARLNTPHKIRRGAEKAQKQFLDDLEAVGSWDGVAIGAPPGAKGFTRIKEKLVDKPEYNNDPSNMTDIIRATFFMNTPGAQDDIIAALSKRWPTIVEDWNVTPAGYFDRVVLVRLDDGRIAEIQMVETNMFKAKKAKGHDLYTDWRAESKADRGADIGKAGELNAEMQALYGDALDKAGETWIQISEGKGGGSFSSKKSPNSASETSTDPRSVTRSPEFISTQSVSATRTNAVLDSESNIAGQPSRENLRNVGTVKTSSDIIPKTGEKSMDAPPVREAGEAVERLGDELYDVLEELRARENVTDLEARIDKDGEIEIDILKIDEAARGSGEGSSALRSLQDLADREGVALILEAARNDNLVVKPGLHEFYTGNGFTRQGSETSSYYRYEPRAQAAEAVDTAQADAARLAEAAKDTGNEALDPANNADLFDTARARMDMEDMEVSAGYRDDGTEILKSARQYAKELDEELEGLKALETCIKGK